MEVKRTTIGFIQDNKMFPDFIANDPDFVRYEIAQDMQAAITLIRLIADKSFPAEILFIDENLDPNKPATGEDGAQLYSLCQKLSLVDQLFIVSFSNRPQLDIPRVRPMLRDIKIYIEGL